MIKVVVRSGMLPKQEKDLQELIEQSKVKGLVTPSYQGRCISNIPDTVSKIFHQPNITPLSSNEVYALAEDATKIVFLLFDGLGYDSVFQGLSSNSIPSLKSFLQGSFVSSLTSVFPSTTSTATTSLHTGLTPQEHGVIGYSMYLQEYGTVAETLSFAPILHSRYSFFDMGLDPQAFIGGTTIHERLMREGISSEIYISKWIRGSGLSKITNRGAIVHPHLTAADMFTRLRKRLGENTSNSFHFAYFASPDTVAHARGPFSAEYASELDYLFYIVQSELMQKLDRQSGRKTFLMVSADHGLYQVNEQDVIDTARHSELVSFLKVPPCGDSRALVLHVRPGMTDRVAEYFTRHFQRQFEVLPSEEALRMGLFGRGKVKEELKDRMGDLIAVPRGGQAIDNSQVYPRTESMPGRHGGLSREEMIVPLIARRLGT